MTSRPAGGGISTWEAWIDDYDRDRRHSSIGMVSPIASQRSLDPEAAE
jgi:hypothetical protein